MRLICFIHGNKHHEPQKGMYDINSLLYVDYLFLMITTLGQGELTPVDTVQGIGPDE